MLKDFQNMPDHSRIWVYAASRNFTPEEQLRVEAELKKFVAGWETHGQPMSGSYAIEYGRIILLVADEQFLAASGCSIDKQVHLIKKIEEELQISLLDKQWVYVKTGQELSSYRLSELKSQVDAGKITSNSLILNNLCPTLGAWKKDSFLPANQTWTKRYFTYIQV